MKADVFTGVDFKIKMVDIDGTRVKLQVLDVPLCIFASSDLYLRCRYGIQPERRDFAQ